MGGPRVPARGFKKTSSPEVNANFLQAQVSRRLHPRTHPRIHTPFPNRARPSRHRVNYPACVHDHVFSGPVCRKGAGTGAGAGGRPRDVPIARGRSTGPFSLSGYVPFRVFLPPYGPLLGMGRARGPVRGPGGAGGLPLPLTLSPFQVPAWSAAAKPTPVRPSPPGPARPSSGSSPSCWWAPSPPTPTGPSCSRRIPPSRPSSTRSRRRAGCSCPTASPAPLPRPW